MSILIRLRILARILALQALPCFAIACCFGNWALAIAFAFFFLVCGVAELTRLLPATSDLADDGGGMPNMAEVAIAWLAVACLGAVPYVFAAIGPASGLEQATFALWTNAIFESMSGYTSTGLTVSSDPSQLAASLQLWRSSSQWIGGVGIIFFGLLVTEPSDRSDALMGIEGRTGLLKDIDGFRWGWILSIYVGYTAFAMVGFALLGMPVWEAVNHGLTAISTGGFSITPDSFVSYSSEIKLFTMLIMVLGTLSFVIHYRIWQGRLPLHRSGLRFFLFSLIGALLLTGWLRGDDFINAAFSIVSASTTSGFSVEPVAGLPGWQVMFMIVLMILGGLSGSTAGGIKSFRSAWLGKAILARIISASREDDNVDFSFDGESMEERQARCHIHNAAVMVSLWFVLIVAATLALSYLERAHDLGAVTFDAASALSGVGLSSGVIGAESSQASKWLAVLVMWAGRLEIVSVLVLFIYLFRWRSRR